MKKISLVLAIFLISANANATSSAGATLSNFQLNVVSGDALVPYLDTLSVGINNNVSDKFITNSYDYTFNSGLPFSLSLTTIDGLSSATGNSVGSNQSQTLTANASTPDGSASSAVSGNLAIAYKAFTLFSFSADATVFDSADVTNGIDSTNSSSQISLSKASFDGAFSTTNIYSDLTSGSGLYESGAYSSSKRIKFFFFDDEDGFLQLNASLNASALAVPNLAPVPEPETYALFIAGLGLIGFTLRRSKLK